MVSFRRAYWESCVCCRVWRREAAAPPSDWCRGEEVADQCRQWPQCHLWISGLLFWWRSSPVICFFFYVMCNKLIPHSNMFFSLSSFFRGVGSQKSDTESVASSEPPILTRSTSQDSEASTVVGHGQVRHYALHKVYHNMNCRSQEDGFALNCLIYFT